MVPQNIADGSANLVPAAQVRQIVVVAEVLALAVASNSTGQVCSLADGIMPYTLLCLVVARIVGQSSEISDCTI